VLCLDRTALLTLPDVKPGEAIFIRATAAKYYNRAACPFTLRLVASRQHRRGTAPGHL